MFVKENSDLSLLRQNLKDDTKIYMSKFDESYHSNNNFTEFSKNEDRPEETKENLTQQS